MKELSKDKVEISFRTPKRKPFLMGDEKQKHFGV